MHHLKPPVAVLGVSFGLLASRGGVRPRPGRAFSRQVGELLSALRTLSEVIHGPIVVLPRSAFISSSYGFRIRLSDGF
jgi:hypothetical protein